MIVAAAGNQGEGGNPRRDPAVLNHVLTVAATDVEDGPLAFSNRNLAVDLAAPGQNILVAIPAWFQSQRYTAHFDFKDGTSFSAPLVSAAAAWVWTVRPSLDRTQVGANGLFASADPPLTGPGRGTARIRALLDVTEDPVDVYRMWVPGRSEVVVGLDPEGGNVDLEVFRTTAKTVYYKSRARALRGPLIAYSERPRGRAERVELENDGRTGEFVYVAAYLPEGGPLDGSYTLTARTRR